MKIVFFIIISSLFFSIRALDGHRQLQDTLMAAIATSNQIKIDELLNNPSIRINEPQVTIKSDLVDMSEVSIASVYVKVVEETSTTPLLAAVRLGNVDIVKKLLNSDADANGKSYFKKKHDGKTIIYEEYYPLITAAEKGDIKMVKLLLSKNADINIKNSNDKSAIARAAAQEHLDIVKLLMDNGAHI